MSRQPSAAAIARVWLHAELNVPDASTVDLISVALANIEGAGDAQVMTVGGLEALA
jgi:hypothetical protein